MRDAREIEKAIISFTGKMMLTKADVRRVIGKTGHSTADSVFKQLSSYDPNHGGRKLYFAHDVARYIFATQQDIGELDIMI